MNPQKIKLIQVIGEAIVPILGYFYWDWNFYFIALFYFLDVLANSVMLHFKLNKFANFKQNKTKVFPAYFLIAGLLCALFYLGVLFSNSIIPDFDFKTETIKFIMEKEMGIPQGILLLPLIFYGAFMQYKMEFLAQKKMETSSLKLYLNKHVFSLLFTLVLLGFALLTSINIQISQIVALTVLILLTSFYSYFYKR